MPNHAQSLMTFLIVALALLATACASTDRVEHQAPFPLGELHPLEINTSSADRLGVSDAVNPRDGGPYRTFVLPLDRNDVLRIVVETSDFTPSITLFAPDGTLVGSTERRGATNTSASHHYDPYAHHYYDPSYHYGYDPYGHGHSTNQYDGLSGRRSLIRRAATPGNYFLVVSSMTSGEYGSFQISTETIDQATDFAFPANVVGFLYEGGRIHPTLGTLINAYPLELSEPQAVELSLTSRDFTPQISIVDAATEVVLTTAMPRHGATGANILTELPAGSYEIWVSAFHSGPDGRYTLNAQPGHIDRSESFELGQAYRGFLSWNRTAIPSSMRRGEPLTFEIEERTILDALMNTTDFNSYLVLTDEQGRILHEDAYSGGIQNHHYNYYQPGVYDARIYWLLEPGTYTLWATSEALEGSGAYRVTTSLHTAPEGETVSVGGNVRGAITQASPMSMTRYTPMEYFTLEIEETQEVRIDLADHDFDGFLVLEDEWGQHIAESEYIYYGTANTQITRELEPGIYRIGVTNLSGQSFGIFNLRVRLVGPSRQQG